MEFTKINFVGELHDIEVLNMQDGTVKVIMLQKIIPYSTTEFFNIDDPKFTKWIENNKKHITITQ